MFGNYFESFDYYDKVKKLEKKLRGQKDPNQDSCKGCSYCCWQKPCNLSKEDIGIMANHFKLTPQELFKKYLVIDDACAEDGKFTLTPIREEWAMYAGHYLPSHATFDINTPCVFLDKKEKKCTLHDLAKPFGGRTLECWNQNDGDDAVMAPSFTKKELKESVGWNGDEYWNDSCFDDDEFED